MHGMAQKEDRFDCRTNNVVIMCTLITEYQIALFEVNRGYDGSARVRTLVIGLMRFEIYVKAMVKSVGHPLVHNPAERLQG